jgi:predicted metal-dependent phosphoesterase TrpH
MILDMHAHSIKSDDGRAKVENYCQWIKAKNISIDGFILTEHRQFDNESDYSELGKINDITILKGSEVETEYGHVLVFGVTLALQEEFDFSNINLELEQVIDACNKHDAIAVPCHPGRPRVGMAAHLEEFGVPNGVEVVEIYNGGSRENEDEIAIQMAKQLSCSGIGGSDAHIVSQIGKCGTKFDAPITTINELVEALKSNSFTAVKLQQEQ